MINDATHDLSIKSTVISASRDDSINTFRVAYRAGLAGYIILVSLFLFGNGYYLSKVADAKKLKQSFRVSIRVSARLLSKSDCSIL